MFLANVCKVFLSQSTGKMLGRKHLAPAQQSVMDFFDAKKGKYQTTVSVIHVVALVAVFTSQFYRLD